MIFSQAFALLKKPLNPNHQVDLFSYRNDIDGLRGIAVLAVILFHLDKFYLPGGFTGVDIFFVISGYVVTRSILNHTSKNIPDYLLGFYARRVVRLAPALLVCITLTTLLTAIFIFPGATAPMFSLASRALVGWSNNYLIASSSDYFGLNAELNPFTHTWSLGVEEQFYAVFPLFLLAVYGFRPTLKKNLKLGFFLLIIIIVTSLIFSSFSTTNNPIFAYYSIPSRLWELACGAAVFAGFRVKSPLSSSGLYWHLLVLQLASIALITASTILTLTTSQFPFPYSILAVAGAVAFIIAGTDKSSKLNQIVATPKLVFVGKISYSLYLWHWPIFVLFKWTVGFDSILNKAIAFIACCLISLISYYFIEQPIRNFRPKNKFTVFSGAFCGVISTFALTFLIAKPFKDLLYPGPAVSSDDWWQPNPSAPIVPNTNITSQCLFSASQNNITHAQLANCSAGYAPKKLPFIYLMGDSHAFSLIPMLGKAYNSGGLGFSAITMPGCPVSLSMDIAHNGKQDSPSACRKYIDSQLQIILDEGRPGDIVLVSSYYLGYQPFRDHQKFEPNQGIEGFIFNNHLLSFQEAKLRLTDDLVELSKRLNQKGINLILQAPLPVYKLGAQQCLPVWFSSGLKQKECFVDRLESLAYREPVMSVMQQVSESNPNVYIWDPFFFVCPDKKCSHFDGGKPLFRDSNHLSAYGSQYLSNYFAEFLKQKKLAFTYELMN